MMLPREFDPNTFDTARQDQLKAVEVVNDLTRAPGDLTIKQDDDCPRWTAFNTFQVICLVAVVGLMIWALERAW